MMQTEITNLSYKFLADLVKLWVPKEVEKNFMDLLVVAANQVDEYGSIIQFCCHLFRLFIVTFVMIMQSFSSPPYPEFSGRSRGSSRGMMGLAVG